MRLVRLLLALLLLAIAGLVPVSAASPTPPPGAASGPGDSAGNRIGGAADLSNPADIQPTSGPSILCFTTRIDTTDPCARVSAIFSTVTTVRSLATFPADLSPYDVVYIGYGEGNLLDGHAGQLTAYVAAGGGLIVSQPDLAGSINVYPPGFDMTVTSITWPGYPSAPGPVEFTSAGATHPILSGLTPADLSGNFDTIPLSTLGPGWTVLAKSVAYPHVALAVGRYGSGRIAFDSGNIAAASIDSGSDAYIRQLITWAGTSARPGPDMRINAIEVTQAIQDLNNSVDLIANKRTYVRVHVSSPTTIGHVAANLSGQRGGFTLFPTLTPGNPGGDITVRTSPDRAQLNDSFWFELPWWWLGAGNLTLTARLDPADAKHDPNLSNNTSSVTVNFKSTPPLRLRITNVRYQVGGTTYLAANSHLDRLESWLRRAYPISSLSVSRATFTYPSSGLPNVDTLNSWLAFIKLLRRIFTGEDGRTVYYGMVDDGGGFMRGKAAGIPGTVASGPTGTPSGSFAWDTDGSYGDWYGGHEIGHTRNRYHAEFCGATGGATYPYPNGRISPALTGNTAIYGFDIGNRTIYDPNWKDVMTYCQNQWVSDFTYEGIRSYLASLGLAEAAAAPVASNSFLLVGGLVDLDSKTGALNDVSLIEQPSEQPLPVPGDWTIALVGASGAVLATYPFSPDELTDAEESPGHPAIVSEIVPWVSGATRVELRYGSNVVDARNTSAHAPEVTITAPQAGQQLGRGPFTFSWSATDADGNPLTYSVLYSNDGGQTWNALTTALTEQQFTIDTRLLPGGSLSRLRVVASDGLLSGVATSENFVVPTTPPQVTIAAPAEAETFFPAQLVTLQGSAYDAEDGQLDGASLHWSSDRDGDLGTGPVLSTVNLSTGTHVITLSATDSQGQTSQAQRTIYVLAGTNPEIDALDVAPAAIGVTALVGDAPTTYAVTIRNSAENVLNWTADTDVAWLRINAASGATPGGFTLTVDPAGLAPGTYTGAVTISAGGAANSPKTIPVVLEVRQRYFVYMPLIMR